MGVLGLVDEGMDRDTCAPLIPPSPLPRNFDCDKFKFLEVDEGKSSSSVFHCSYNPFDGPNENPEAELPLTAGKYLYVYGDMDEDGFYEGLPIVAFRFLVSTLLEFKARFANTARKETADHWNRQNELQTAGGGF